MNEFLNVAKDLDIKEIGKNVVDEEDEVLNCNTNLENPEEINENQSNIESNVHNPIQSRPVFNGNSSNSMLPGDKQCQCQQCDYQTKYSHSLQIHVKSIHEGLKYQCQQCDYQATDPSSLRQHIKSKHEGVKYPCQQCDYQFTNPSSLRQHIKSKHEGVRYPCQQCDNQFTKHVGLIRHMKSKHEGLKYSCQ